jgi:hypothetical protein
MRTDTYSEMNRRIFLQRFVANKQNNAKMYQILI